MIVGSRMPVVYDEWEEEGVKHRLCSRGGGPMEVEAWWVTGGWQVVPREKAAPLVMRRLVLRVSLNNIEARRISFLAAALMRVLQLAEVEVKDSLHLVRVKEDPKGFVNLAKRHLAAVKGVLLACKMPLERWEVGLDGVEEDPETAEARRRLGLDTSQAS